ncbi:MAG: double-strand break repair protein AddB [Micavibrio aeruginosavorus]|uniref:Double-strand break repair protein AddB n=1 Tax=Micavibrio aeruginosavorus TaxID=349221 RepID=A0A2W5N7W8_9BACT|nr:MAG: double-strand break repair protein AddB [Micavibrio aeruginosavorus]
MPLTRIFAAEKRREGSRMSKIPATPRIYTIPAGVAFVDALAKGILDKAGKDPMTLASMQILLPTRRACRSLREAFLKITNGAPLMLPRMDAIGDVDDEELSLLLSGIEQELSLPPAISSMRRTFLLAELIGKMGRSRGIEQDLSLADALGRLMDQIYTEDLDLKNLEHAIDNSDLADHWQISLKFLEILSDAWPKILQERGVMDAADRRNRLLKSLADYWTQNPPAHPVIAAGSTGSIPAAAALLKTISSLPDGCIVLPGLDQDMDAQSWDALDDTHPQATLKHLLQTLSFERSDVALWPSCKDDESAKKRRAFCTEVMRPSETSQEWQTLQSRLALSEGDLTLERYDCATQEEEALTIALSLRGILEDKEKTAALVTPDRRLARRVAMACRRWGIEIDDSAGQMLSDTQTGTYLRLCIETLCNELKPVALLNFSKHALCLPADFRDWRQAVCALDKHVFRGPAFSGGLHAHESKLADMETRGKETAGFRKTLGFIETAFAPLIRLNDGKAHPFAAWADAHLQVCETFCGPAILWSGEAGDAAAKLFSEIFAEAGHLPELDARQYLAALEHMMKGIAVRPAFGLHPRLMILGQLEARLVGADVMILSGLNEKTWPPDAGLDPWMSRPMRKRFGLPSPERSIGLSAHDFAQCLCADKTILTRSMRVDGAPTVPARWLQRMDAVLSGLGLKPESVLHGDALDWARQLDHIDEKDYKPLGRPDPRPPVEARPRALPVTAVETWMKDPYGIYARYILGLRKLKPLEQKLDAAMRGTIVHDALHKFGELYRYEEILPADAAQTLLAVTRKELDATGVEQDARRFWEPRLEKTAHWIVRHENAWRNTFMPEKFESTGTLSFQGPAGEFILSAKADRIDYTKDGAAAAIIDYKTGGTFSSTGMIDGRYPQLPLEALILEAGGFAAKPAPVESLVYWIIGGGEDGGKVKELKKTAELKKAKENAAHGLEKLIAVFDKEETPYYSLPRPDLAPRFNDYEHLARVKEWTALGEQEDSA